MYKWISDFYHKHPLLSHLVMVCCVGVFLCVLAMFFVDIWTNHGSTTVVPEVRQKPYSEAVKTLRSYDLKCEIADSVYDSKTPPGTVKESWPHPGTHVKPGRVVYLTVNSFEPQKVTVTMPLTGVSSRQAVTYLESLNIKNIRIVYVPSNFPDLVEGARYKGRSITPGTQLPVTADIVLEVGTKRAEPEPALVDDIDDEPIDDDIDLAGMFAPKADDPAPKPETAQPAVPAAADEPQVFE